MAEGRPQRSRLGARRAAAAGMVGVAMVVVVALVAWPSGGDGSGSGAASSSHAAIELELFGGGSTTLDELKGRPVVVNFFASWCPPCAAEMPDFEAVHRGRRDEVAFIGLALQDSRSAAEALVVRTGVSYAVAEDPGGALYRAFGGIAMPTTVFLDAEGQVVRRHSGILSRSQLSERIDELVGDR